MTAPRVKLLVLTTCLQCKALKELLSDKGVDFESIDVDLLLKDERDELFKEIKYFNEKKAFPVTFIDDKVILGYQKSLILEMLGLE